MQVEINGVDITGIYVMALEGTISKQEFENKVEELTGKKI